MTALSVVVASSGRSTLTRTLESITSQMLSGDEILLSVNNDCPWGHAARNQLMPAARGDMLLFMDDDDTYVSDALQTVRDCVGDEQHLIHMFKMRYRDGQNLWSAPEIGDEPGNVSTVMFCVPRAVAQNARWGDRYEGDYDFIVDAATHAPAEICWHYQVIALVRPDGG
jgi:glycosyltransferase involved in cell wall biosynthesis